MFHIDIFFIASEITVDNHSEEVNWFLWESHWQVFNQKGLIFPEKKKRRGVGEARKESLIVTLWRIYSHFSGSSDWVLGYHIALYGSTLPSSDPVFGMCTDRTLHTMRKKKKVQSQLFLLSVHHLNTKKHDLKRKKKIFMLISIYTLSCTQVLQRNLLRALW